MEEFARRIVKFEKAHAIKSQESQASDFLTIACGWCLRGVRVSLSGLALGERVLYERMDAVHDARTLCAPENATLYDEIEAALKRRARADYGDLYGEYERMTEEFQQRMNEIAARKAPRKIYRCRVPNCECEYPKTEGEWHRNVQRKLAA